jgi:hypothetical protein
MSRVDIGDHLDGEPSFIGGLRLPNVFLNFGWPGARLTLRSDGVVIGPSWAVFRPFVPSHRFRYDDLAEVQAVGQSKITCGIRFVSRSTGKYAIFWTFSRPKVLGRLREHVQVNESPVRLDYFHPGPES